MQKSMKTLALTLVFILPLGLLAGCGGSASDSSTPDPFTDSGAENGSGPVVTWRAQSTEVAGTARYDCTQYFVDLVSERSGGNFTIELYSADTLYPISGTVEAVQNNVTQAAFTSGDYNSGKEPMFKLQAYRPSDNWFSSELDEAFFAMYEPLVVEAYDSIGVSYATTVLDLPGESFHSNKPIQTLDDYNGLLVRSAGLGQEMYSKLGASVVTMPMGDVYTALKLNTIEAFEAGGYIDNYQNALHEVVSYNIEPALHSTSGVMVGQMIVNNDEYEKLPDEYKELLRECGADARKYTFDTISALDVEAKAKFEAEGVETIVLPDEEVAKAKVMAASIMKEYWGESEMCDRFLTLYVEFLRDHDLDDLADQVEK